MDALDRAKSAALSRIAEISENLSIRQGFMSFIVGRSSEIFAATSPGAKSELTQLLRFRSSDPTVVYRGLLTQLNATFELYIKQLSAATLEYHASKAKNYSDLPAPLQEAHVISSAAVLSKLGDRQINGMNYDFTRLQSALGSCLSGTTPYTLNTDVLTLQIGNCLPDRLDALFHKLLLGKAFTDELGKNKLVKAWSGNLSARDATNAAHKELIRQISVRNDIAHSAGASRDIQPLDVEDACKFFEAIIEALFDKARAQISPSK